MRFAKWVFRIAGIYGLVAISPMYGLEDWVGRIDPPSITHPEYYFGFLGVAIVWQIGFLVIATDPVRYRAFMVLSVLEKVSFGIPVVWLYARERVSGQVLALGLIDLGWGLLFLLAYRQICRHDPALAEVSRVDGLQ